MYVEQRWNFSFNVAFTLFAFALYPELSLSFSFSLQSSLVSTVNKCYEGDKSCNCAFRLRVIKILYLFCFD